MTQISQASSKKCDACRHEPTCHRWTSLQAAGLAEKAATGSSFVPTTSKRSHSHTMSRATISSLRAAAASPVPSAPSASRSCGCSWNTGVSTEAQCRSRAQTACCLPWLATLEPILPADSLPASLFLLWLKNCCFRDSPYSLALCPLRKHHSQGLQDTPWNSALRLFRSGAKRCCATDRPEEQPRQCCQTLPETSLISNVRSPRSVLPCVQITSVCSRLQNASFFSSWGQGTYPFHESYFQVPPPYTYI